MATQSWLIGGAVSNKAKGPVSVPGTVSVPPIVNLLFSHEKSHFQRFLEPTYSYFLVLQAKEDAKASGDTFEIFCVLVHHRCLRFGIGLHQK